jgi:pimeloyl-ACP methyl ester carboxylesterase
VKTSEVGAADETPIYVEGRHGALFTVVTQPSTAPNGLSAILLHGGGENTSLQRNRFWVRLARQLAARGFHVARFDNHGVGDSAGEVTEFRLEAPFVDDLCAIRDAMADLGINEVVLVGTCIGARASLAFAAEAADVRAAVLLMMPVLDYVKGEKLVAHAPNVPFTRFVKKGLSRQAMRGLASPQKRQVYVRAARAKLRTLVRRRDTDRVSASVRSDLRRVSATRTPLLMVYGEHDVHLRDFRVALDGPLAFTKSSASVEVRIVEADADISGLADLSIQDDLIDLVCGWLVEHSGDSV